MLAARAPKRKTVAVTGAAGYIAGLTIDRLLSDDRVERVLGFDVREPPASRARDRFLFDTLDVRNPSLEGRLRGVDVLIHLAFVMNPIHDEATMRDVNVNGSQNVFRCAGQAGVPKIVYTSSAVVYGAHPDNDVPLTEDSPLRANLDFSYSAHKLEVEYVVREFLSEFPKTKFVTFRPAIVFGSHVDNAWSHALEFPVLFSVKGFTPPIQFVHEEDVARALEFAVFEELDGAYNLAADGWLDPEEALRIVGRRRSELPEPIAFVVADRLWGMGVSEAPAGMLHYLMHPWVVSPEKLARAGFQARRSNAETLAQAAEKARGHVRIGKTRLRRAYLLRGAVAGAGVVGAVATARRVARRA